MCRRDHGDSFGLAGLSPVGDLFLPPGSGPDSPLQVRPRPLVGRAGGEGLGRVGAVLRTFSFLRVCRRWKRLVNDGWLWRHIDLSVYQVSEVGGADLGRGLVAGPQGPAPSHPGFPARLSWAHPGCVAYVFFCDLLASVSPSPKRGLPRLLGNGLRV